MTWHTWAVCLFCEIGYMREAYEGGCRVGEVRLFRVHMQRQSMVSGNDDIPVRA